VNEAYAWLRRLGYKNWVQIELVARKLLNGDFDFRA